MQRFKFSWLCLGLIWIDMNSDLFPRPQTSSAVLRRNRFESQLMSAARWTYLQRSCHRASRETEETLEETEENSGHVLAVWRDEQFRRSETTIVVSSWTPSVWATVSGKAGRLQETGEVANQTWIMGHCRMLHCYMSNCTGEKSGRSGLYDRATQDTRRGGRWLHMVTHFLFVWFI